MRRTKLVSFRVSHEEYAVLEAQSVLEGRTVSGLLRHQLFLHAEPRLPVDHPEYRTQKALRSRKMAENRPEPEHTAGNGEKGAERQIR